MKLSICLCLFAALLGLATPLRQLRIPLPLEVKAAFPKLLALPSAQKATTRGGGSLRVSGGSEASKESSPYQAAVYLGTSFVCGGVLIGEKTVLTAAHCVYGHQGSPSSFSIRYGNVTLSGTKQISVTKVTMHSSYSPSTMDYNVALLQLLVPFQPSPTASAIKLAGVVPFAGTTVTATGWGRTTDSGNTLPNTLQVAKNLQVLSLVDCQTRWDTSAVITPRMWCAHSVKESTCAGDSGGPVVQNGMLFGLVSWGPSSCAVDEVLPNVYTSVASVKAWIEANSQVI